MRLIEELFGKSPFVPLLEHTKRVEKCVALLRPLMDALAKEDYDEVHRLQDEVCRYEYEADQIKNEIRENLPSRMFLPVDRQDIDRFLHEQDGIADALEAFANLLQIRRTRIHPALAGQFFELVDQVVLLCGMVLRAADEMLNLAEASFGGAEAKVVLELVSQRNEAEWKADRMRRRLTTAIYEHEQDLDPITIMFYEKILSALAETASSAENSGDVIRSMIVKG